MIGLGKAPIGGLYSPVDDETAWATLDRAWELGIRTFDTAPLYGSGLAERRLGAFLRGKQRDTFVLSTKVGRLLRPDASGWEGAYFDFSYDGALRSLTESLDRLGLEVVGAEASPQLCDLVRHPRVLRAGGVPEVLMRVDDHSTSSHSASGMSSNDRRRSSATSAGVRQPTTIVFTAGCRSGYCNAAAASGTL